ncbi:MAG: addiction module antidote protein [Bacteroidota bacterium]|nr:addiction module antidote protein [Bacteroidota bacterium]
MVEKFSKFEVYEFLDSDSMIEGYLEEVLKDGDPKLILSALNDIAKAKGMSKIAEKSGLGRESMYKALKPDAKPRFETIMKIIHAMGFTLSVQTPPPKALAEDKGKYKT